MSLTYNHLVPSELYGSKFVLKEHNASPSSQGRPLLSDYFLHTVQLFTLQVRIMSLAVEEQLLVDDSLPIPPIRFVAKQRYRLRKASFGKIIDFFLVDLIQFYIQVYLVRFRCFKQPLVEQNYYSLKNLLREYKSDWIVEFLRYYFFAYILLLPKAFQTARHQIVKKYTLNSLSSLFVGFNFVALRRIFWQFFVRLCVFISTYIHVCIYVHVCM